MPLKTSPLIAVSSWSVHNLLGITYSNGPGETSNSAPNPTYGPGVLSLLDLPAELARRGFNRAEICHFHLAGQEPAYLAKVRNAFAGSRVTIQTLLIDDGDITNPATRERDIAWIKFWIDAAALLGAERARVIAGKATPSESSLGLAVEGLKILARHGRERSVRIVTENWYDLLSSPKEVHHVLDALAGELGFLADTGNWEGSTKYENLKSVFGRAELCHAKCSFGNNFVMDTADYKRCLDAAAEAGYKDPYTLIFESPGDEWQALQLEHDFIQMHAGQGPPERICAHREGNGP